MCWTRDPAGALMPTVIRPHGGSGDGLGFAWSSGLKGNREEQGSWEGTGKPGSEGGTSVGLVGLPGGGATRSQGRGPRGAVVPRCVEAGGQGVGPRTPGGPGGKGQGGGGPA